METINASTLKEFIEKCPLSSRSAEQRAKEIVYEMLIHRKNSMYVASETKEVMESLRGLGFEVKQLDDKDAKRKYEFIVRIPEEDEEFTL